MKLKTIKVKLSWFFFLQSYSWNPPETAGSISKGDRHATSVLTCLCAPAAVVTSYFELWPDLLLSTLTSMWLVVMSATSVSDGLLLCYYCFWTMFLSLLCVWYYATRSPFPCTHDLYKLCPRVPILIRPPLCSTCNGGCVINLSIFSVTLDSGDIRYLLLSWCRALSESLLLSQLLCLLLLLLFCIFSGSSPSLTVAFAEWQHCGKNHTKLIDHSGLSNLTPKIHLLTRFNFWHI